MTARRHCPIRLAHPRPERAEALLCRFRGTCLEAAAAAGYQAMSCEGCPDLAVMEREDWLTQIGPLIELAAAIVMGDGMSGRVRRDHVLPEERERRQRVRERRALKLAAAG